MNISGKKIENLFKIILNYGLKGSRWRIVKTADSTFGWKPVLGTGRDGLGNVCIIVM